MRKQTREGTTGWQRTYIEASVPETTRSEIEIKRPPTKEIRDTSGYHTVYRNTRTLSEPEQTYASYMVRYDAILDSSIAAHPVAKLFAQIPEMQDGEVTTQQHDHQITVDKRERKAMDGQHGDSQNKSVFDVATRLDARHGFTDAAACDGAKRDYLKHPYARDEIAGATAYGIWEGILQQEADTPSNLFQQRLLQPTLKHYKSNYAPH